MRMMERLTSMIAAVLFCLSLGIASLGQEPDRPKPPRSKLSPEELRKLNREFAPTYEGLNEMFKTGKKPQSLEGKTDEEVYFEILKNTRGGAEFVPSDWREKFVVPKTKAGKDNIVEGQYTVMFTYEIHEALVDPTAEEIAKKYNVKILTTVKTVYGSGASFEGLSEKEAKEISQDPRVRRSMPRS